MLFPTTIVGSFPQPEWLIDRARLAGRFPPRVRAKELWRVAPEYLKEAQDDATVLAIRDQERAGLDVISDGEMRRESYSNRFATALEGVDIDNPGTALDRSGHPNPVPRVTGKVKRKYPVQVDDVKFLRANAQPDRAIKITVPGPFTLSSLAQDEHYGDPERLAMAYADAVNAELRELEPIVDWVQLDEPYLQAHPDRGRAYGLTAIDRALAGLRKPTCIHLCFGYAFTHALAGSTKSGGYKFLTELDRSSATQVSIEAAQPRLDLAVLAGLPSKTIVLGVIDLGDPAPETPDVVARRLDAALKHVPAARLVAAPDCGMKYLPRSLARAKLQALVAGVVLLGRGA